MEDSHQYDTETSAWLKKLDTLQQENIRLKNRVADIIRNDIDGQILDSVEIFLNSFLNKDVVFSLLRRDIASVRNGSATEAQYEKLKKDIRRIEVEFNKLRKNFDVYTARISPAS